MPARILVEQKTYYRTEWEPEFREFKMPLFLCQHVNVTHKGEVRKAWVHRLNPVKVEVVLYGGPTLRVDPFAIEPLETQHW